MRPALPSVRSVHAGVVRLLALAALSGCVGEDVFVSEIVFLPLETCLDEGDPVMADTYLVEVYQAPRGIEPRLLGVDCEKCEEEGCSLVHQSCRCGTPREASVQLTEASIEGLEFDVDGASSICVRVIALSRAPSPPGECACEEQWSTPAFLAMRGGMCGFSRPASVTRAEQTIRVGLACPDDAEAFSSCIDPFNL